MGEKNVHLILHVARIFVSINNRPFVIFYLDVRDTLVSPSPSEVAHMEFNKLNLAWHLLAYNYIKRLAL